MLLSHGKMYVLTVRYAYMNKASFHVLVDLGELLSLTPIRLLAG